MPYESLQPQPIALNPEAADLPDRHWRNIGMMPKCLAFVNIAEMHFDCGEIHSSDRVTQGNAGVSIATGINQNTLVHIQGSVNMVDQCPFVI